MFKSNDDIYIESIEKLVWSETSVEYYLGSKLFILQIPQICAIPELKGKDKNDDMIIDFLKGIVANWVIKIQCKGEIKSQIDFNPIDIVFNRDKIIDSIILQLSNQLDL